MGWLNLTCVIPKSYTREYSVRLHLTREEASACVQLDLELTGPIWFLSIHNRLRPWEEALFFLRQIMSLESLGPRVYIPGGQTVLDCTYEDDELHGWHTTNKHQRARLLLNNELHRIDQVLQTIHDRIVDTLVPELLESSTQSEAFKQWCRVMQKAQHPPGALDRDLFSELKTIQWTVTRSEPCADEQKHKTRIQAELAILSRSGHRPKVRMAVDVQYGPWTWARTREVLPEEWKSLLQILGRLDGKPPSTHVADSNVRLSLQGSKWSWSWEHFSPLISRLLCDWVLDEVHPRWMKEEEEKSKEAKEAKEVKEQMGGVGVKRHSQSTWLDAFQRQSRHKLQKIYCVLCESNSAFPSDTEDICMACDPQERPESPDTDTDLMAELFPV